MKYLDVSLTIYTRSLWRKQNSDEGNQKRSKQMERDSMFMGK